MQIKTKRRYQHFIPKGWLLSKTVKKRKPCTPLMAMQIRTVVNNMEVPQRFKIKTAISSSILTIAHVSKKNEISISERQLHLYNY
jgi:hypothetical protein